MTTLEKKVVFVGDSKVGKSNLVSALAGKKFREKSPTTFDSKKVVFKLRNDDQEDFTRLSLELADTSGDEEYDRLRYRGSRCFHIQGVSLIHFQAIELPRLGFSRDLLRRRFKGHAEERFGSLGPRGRPLPTQSPHCARGLEKRPQG